VLQQLCGCWALAWVLLQALRHHIPHVPAQYKHLKNTAWEGSMSHQSLPHITRKGTQKDAIADEQGAHICKLVGGERKPPASLRLCLINCKHQPKKYVN